MFPRFLIVVFWLKFLCIFKLVCNFFNNVLFSHNLLDLLSNFDSCEYVCLKFFHLRSNLIEFFVVFSLFRKILNKIWLQFIFFRLFFSFFQSKFLIFFDSLWNLIEFLALVLFYFVPFQITFVWNFFDVDFDCDFLNISGFVQVFLFLGFKLVWVPVKMPILSISFHLLSNWI